MTYVMTDGVLGLEGVWTWDPFPSWAPSVTLNDLSVFAPTTRIKIEDVAGLYGSPETENNLRKTPPVGEARLPSDTLGKTLTIEALVQAVTDRDLRVGVKALGDSFLADLDRLGTMQVAPHPEYGDEEETQVWECTARVIAFDASAKPDYNPHRIWRLEQPVSIGLRLLDPRWRWIDAAVTGTHASDVTLANTGDAPSDPVIIQTVASSVTESNEYSIGNNTTGRQLVINIPAHDAGDIHWVFGADPDNGLPPRSIVLDPGGDAVDLAPYLNVADSTWWDLGEPGVVPGNNALWQNGGTQISASFYPMTIF